MSSKPKYWFHFQKGREYFWICNQEDTKVDIHTSKHPYISSKKKLAKLFCLYRMKSLEIGTGEKYITLTNTIKLLKGEL